MQPKRELRIRKVDKGLGQGKEEALPRKDTEKHGKDRSRDTERRTHLSEPDA